MTILSRYITKEILKSTLAITIVILLVIGSGRSTYYLSEAVAGDLSGPAVLEIMVNLLPVFLTSILPLGTFIGVLIALGRLSADNEMVVLFANGISLNRLLILVGLPAFMLAGTVLVLSTLVAPYGTRVVEEVLYIEARTSEFEHIVPGKFHSDNNRQVIYAQEISANQNELYNVFVFNQADADKEVLIRAEKARQEYKDEFSAKYLMLENGTQTTLNTATGETVITSFAEMGMLLNDVQIDVTITDSYALPTSVLLSKNSPVYQAQLYWRLSLPLMTIVMVAMAVALSQTKPRQGRFARIVPALVLFLSYLYLLIFFRDQLAANAPASALRMALVHVGFILLTLWLLYGQQWRKAIMLKAANSGKVMIR